MSTERFSNLILGKIFAHNLKYGSVINLKNEKGQIYGLIIGNQSKVILEKSEFPEGNSVTYNTQEIQKTNPESEP